MEAMDWIQSLSLAIKYIENNLTNEIYIDDIADEIYLSGFYFQRIFNLIMGMPVGEYIRNRRLSLAGEEILQTENDFTDIACKFQYETPESFSKAFKRFHGITPSYLRKHKRGLKIFSPFTIAVTIKGGFNMAQKTIDNEEWAAEHEKIIAEIAAHIKLHPEDDIKIIQGTLYTSLLTPDSDGLYRTPLMQSVGSLRKELKEKKNVDLPTIRFLDNGSFPDVYDNEVAITVSNKTVWKTEVNTQDVKTCDDAILAELKSIMERRA